VAQPFQRGGSTTNQLAWGTSDSWQITLPFRSQSMPKILEIREICRSKMEDLNEKNRG